MINNKKTINEIENKIGYTFKNKSLLEQAFTRISYAQEHTDACDNEVLEFVGDSVLGMLVTKHLIHRYKWRSILPNGDGNCFECELDEAELSEMKISLVQRTSLALAAEMLGLERYLRLGNGDIVSGVQGEESVKEDLIEAILGAIAIDSDWDMVKLELAIKRLIDIDARLEQTDNESFDCKKELTEKFGDVELTFEDVPSICSSLDFGCSLTLGRDLLTQQRCYGYGKTKAGARKMAVIRALKQFQNTNDRANTIINAVGKPDVNRAINQLQELFQKKIIPQPKYIFHEESTSQSGNPQWACTCIVEGMVEDTGSYIDLNKNKAKKLAAYHALNILIGRNLDRLFIEYGTKVEEK